MELLRELVGVFLEECPGWLNDIKRAIAEADAAKVKRAAHTLKGAVDHCGASSAFDAALRLERMGREGDLTRAEEAMGALEAELERLRGSLAAFAAGGRTESAVSAATPSAGPT
jgi:HPt (histidine-containing phosphotransfer) domain-containing protein